MSNEMSVKHSTPSTGTTIGFFLLTLIVMLPCSAGSVLAQGPMTDIVFDGIDVHADLFGNRTTEMLLSADVANIGNTSLDHFDFRLDVRGLVSVSASVDASLASVESIPEDHYTILRVSPNKSIAVNSSITFILRVRTLSLQESIGFTEGPMEILHFIYYLRPLHEMRNLTVSAHLPAHAILEPGAAVPLFPKPTTNYTDGSRSVFFWHTASLKVGQETAYIVKYQLPVMTAGSVVTDMNGAFIILAALGGAAAALVIERIPRLASSIASRKRIKIDGVSGHEAEVLRFISEKGGSCPQQEIYESLGLSQSLVSTVLRSLEERGTIKRFKEGRENVVHLIEKE